MVGVVDGAHLTHSCACELHERNLLIVRQFLELAVPPRLKTLRTDCLGDGFHRDAGATAEYVVVGAEDRLSQSIVHSIEPNRVSMRLRRLAE